MEHVDGICTLHAKDQNRYIKIRIFFATIPWRHQSCNLYQHGRPKSGVRSALILHTHALSVDSTFCFVIKCLPSPHTLFACCFFFLPVPIGRAGERRCSPARSQTAPKCSQLGHRILDLRAAGGDEDLRRVQWQHCWPPRDWEASDRILKSFPEGAEWRKAEANCSCLLKATSTTACKLMALAQGSTRVQQIPVERMMATGRAITGGGGGGSMLVL